MTNMSQGRVSFNRGQIFTTVALFRGEIVAVKKSFRKKIAVERSFMQEMKQVRLYSGLLVIEYLMPNSPEHEI